MQVGLLFFVFKSNGIKLEVQSNLPYRSLEISGHLSLPVTSSSPVDFYVINWLKLTVTCITRPTASKFCPKNVKIPILAVTNIFFRRLRSRSGTPYFRHWMTQAAKKIKTKAFPILLFSIMVKLMIESSFSQDRIRECQIHILSIFNTILICFSHVTSCLIKCQQIISRS